MYNYSLYNQTTTGFYTYRLIAFIIALAATIIIYCVFMDKRNADGYSNFVKKIYDYLHFNHFFIEQILKITYIFACLYLTIIAFGYIGTSFLFFITLLIIGNVILRIVYESMMVIYKIYVNLNEINKKIK